MSVSNEFFLSQGNSVRCFLYGWGVQVLKNTFFISILWDYLNSIHFRQLLITFSLILGGYRIIQIIVFLFLFASVYCILLNMFFEEMK